MRTPGDGAEDERSSASSASTPGATATPTVTPSETAPSDIAGLAEVIHELEEQDRPPHAGLVSNLVAAAAVLAIGVAGVVGSLALGVGTPGTPGPGTWPLLASAALVVLAVVLAATARTTHDAERFTRSTWQVVFGLLTMVVFVAVIGVIGFEIPAVVLTFVWLRFLGREGWRLSIVVSVGVVVAFYLIFVVALSVRIPHMF